MYDTISEESLFTILAAVEFFFMATHLMVHLGLKNPHLDFLMKQYLYFIFDLSMTSVNIYYFWGKYYLMRPILIYAILAHIYYVYSMFFKTDICRIFYWSSLDCKENRFSLKYLKENFETATDMSCHLTGFYMFYKSIGFVNKVVCLILSFVSLIAVRRMTPEFYTREYMMPFKLVGVKGD
jgi:hypothetical protein